MSSSKGSRISRAIGFFREAPFDEARAGFIIVREIMEKRMRAPRGEGSLAARRPTALAKPKPAAAAAAPAPAPKPKPAPEEAAVATA